MVQFNRILKNEMFMVFGFDNLEIYSIDATTEPSTGEPAITSLIISSTDQKSQKISTSDEFVSTTDKIDMTTNDFPINKQMYLCNFDRFEKENQCNGTLVNNDNLESFSVLKYAYVQSSDTYITDVTSISITFVLISFIENYLF